MRKLFLYAFAFTLLASCDNFKGSSATEEEETEATTPKKKKKKKVSEEDTELAEEETAEEEPRRKKSLTDDEETFDESESNDGWKSSERSKFMDQCVAQAQNKVSTARAKQYCSCMLDKIEARYASFTEADNTMTDTEMNALAARCNGQ